MPKRTKKTEPKPTPPVIDEPDVMGARTSLFGVKASTYADMDGPGVINLPALLCGICGRAATADLTPCPVDGFRFVETP